MARCLIKMWSPAAKLFEMEATLTLDLYYLEETDSVCSNRVVVTLAEKGITDWTPHKMILMNRDQFKPEYLKINPQGVVPTLVHDGVPIRESSLICKYIDDLYPEPSLKPKELSEQYRMNEWIKLFDERAFEATAVVNFVTKFRLTVPRDKMEERWQVIPSIDRLYRQKSVVLEGVESPYVMRAIGSFEMVFKFMEHALSDDRPYLMGDQFTLAETNLAPFVKVLEMVRFLDFWMEPYPRTRAWWDRMASRPSMQKLDEFPYSAVSEDSPHAKSGRATEVEFRKKLEEYREQFDHAFNPVD